MVMAAKDGQDPKTLKPDGVVLAMFTAKWCGPCKAVKPKLAETQEKFPDVVVVTIDVDECEETTQAYDISAMPTFVIFNKGKEIFRQQGAGNYEGIEKKITECK